MKKYLPVSMVFFVLLIVCFPGSGWSADEADAYPEYSVMRPDRETRLKWIASYEKAPLAVMDKEFGVSKDFAASMDLLSHLDYVPSERNQGACGNCWAWAGTGAMEIALDVEEAVYDRLSVQYINSCESGVIGKACCSGGWLEDFADYYTSTTFAIPWSNTNANWQDGDASCDTSCATVATTPNYPIVSIQEQVITTHDVSQATAIANIKNILNQNRAVWFGFFMPTSADGNNFKSFWNNQGETITWNPDFSCGHTWATGGWGHAVLIVGYNDNDPNNKYWIVVNSWGTPAGRPNGIFRMDMDMNYSCTFNDGGAYWSFYFQALDVDFDVEVTGDQACCNKSETPGCIDADIQAAVCAADPYCCTTKWDGICVDEVTSVYGDTCECCETHSKSEGCYQPSEALPEAVSDCVCEADPYCCNVRWDSLCVNEVDSLGCSTCVECPAPPTPENPDPANGATDVPLDVVLSWNNPVLVSEPAVVNPSPPAIQAEVPRGFYMENGMLVEGDRQLTAPAPQPYQRPFMAPGDVYINFDDISAPCIFSQTSRLTHLYQDKGVVFSGPGGYDGGAILNECGGFSVSGHSSPNFLAFNENASMINGGIPRTLETLTFISSVSSVAAGVASNSGAGETVTVKAYDSIGNLVDSDIVTLSPKMQVFSVSGTGIIRVEITTTAAVFVLDNLMFTKEDCPTTYDVYLGTSPEDMGLVCDDTTGRFCNPGNLETSTTYYWQVVSSGPGGETIGPIWSFTTDNACCNIGGPGCVDQEIEEVVCAEDSYCCKFSWDNFCVEEVATVFGDTCECCETHADAEGCYEPKEPDPQAISDCVCAEDPYCCEFKWDSLCVAEVASLGCGTGACEECPAPPEPANPDPPDGGTDVPLDQVLTWNNPLLVVTATRAEPGQTAPSTEVPIGFYMQGGELIEGERPLEAIPAPVPSRRVLLMPGDTFINFDNLTGPCLFSQTSRLTNEYQGLGVIFSGPGGNDGGAVLDECSNFYVNGHSSPNFLAFNSTSSMQDSGVPRAPETLTFTTPVSYVSALVGTGQQWPGDVTMEAYDEADQLVDSATVTLAPAMAQIFVHGPGIVRVVVTTTSTRFVLDDLLFTKQDCPTTYDVYLGTTGPTNLICQDTALTSCDPGGLEPDTTYYWQVVAKNPSGERIGPEWSFTTMQDICECDLDNNGSCNLLDYFAFGQDYGRTDCNDPGVEPCECDLDNSGACNLLDYFLFGQDYGRTDCPVIGCTPQVCGQYTFDCNPDDSSCICVLTAEGGGTCSPDIPCPPTEECQTSADCASGEVCAVQTCCNINICMADNCAAPAAAGQETSVFDGPTTSGR